MAKNDNFKELDKFENEGLEKLATLEHAEQNPDLLIGVFKDQEDPRDYKYVAATKEKELPKKFNLIKYVGEIENQSTTGSCVAHATVSALELLCASASKEVDLSRLFVYWNIREPYSYLRGKDKGAYLRDGFKSVNKYGVCDESEWEFTKSKVNTKPPQEIYNRAKHNKVLEYRRIRKTDLHAIKDAIYNGHPVIISTALGKQFLNLKGPLKKQKYAPVNGWSNKLVGYHALTIIGYDDELKSFIVENSWGEKWGDNGLGLYPYLCMIRDGIDVWTCTKFMYQDKEIKPEFEPEPKPEPKPDPKPDPKPEPKSEQKSCPFNEDEIKTLKNLISIFNIVKNFFKRL